MEKAPGRLIPGAHSFLKGSEAVVETNACDIEARAAISSVKGRERATGGSKPVRNQCRFGDRFAAQAHIYIYSALRVRFFHKAYSNPVPAVHPVAMLLDDPVKHVAPVLQTKLDPATFPNGMAELLM
jgi:hypothetical protein